MKIRIRIYFEVRGGHTHMTVFSGDENNRGKAGELVMTNEEFEAWRRGMAKLEFMEAL